MNRNFLQKKGSQMNRNVARIAAMRAKEIQEAELVLDKCSMPFVLNAEVLAKFPLSLGMIVQFIAAIVLENKTNLKISIV